MLIYKYHYSWNSLNHPKHQKFDFFQAIQLVVISLNYFIQYKIFFLSISTYLSIFQVKEYHIIIFLKILVEVYYLLVY